MAGPRLSIVIVMYDMAREAPRTVRSLQSPYQLGLSPGETELIVIDNGSPEPLSANSLEPFGPLILLRREPDGISPVPALNVGVEAAQGEYVMVLIDGARMASPGLVARSLEACLLVPNPFIATLGFHLGPATQQQSLEEGYDREIEDGLLRSIDWPEDGYRLFEIAALGESYRAGVMTRFHETTAFVMRRQDYIDLGGFNPGFTGGGGGLANFDFFERAMTAPHLSPIMLLGEATFHQVHYGVTTRAKGVNRREPGEQRTLWETMVAEFTAVVGRAPTLPERRPMLYGRFETETAAKAFFPSRA